MKKAALVLVFALIVGGVIATLMARDAGYVLVVYDDLSFETSLWFALLALVVVLVLVRLLIGAVRRLLRAGAGVRDWSDARRIRHAREQTVRGLVLLAEGDWNSARAALLNAVAKTETPFVNYIAAARAAHELGEAESRDRLLAHAQESAAGSTIGVRLTGAEMLAESGDFAAAEAILAKLHDEAPRHPMVLRRLFECRVQLRDVTGLAALEKEMRKTKILPEAELAAIICGTIVARLAAAEGEEVAGVWESVPKPLKTDTEIVAAAAAAFARSGGADVAEGLLLQSLKSGWSSELINAYGALAGADPDQQLKQVESFIKSHQDDAALFLALGRLAMRSDQLAKGREYLETSLKLAPTAAVYGELGRVCFAMNERERAAEYFAAQFTGS